MANPAQALETQLTNIEKKTGKSRAALKAAVAQYNKTMGGAAKHGEIRDWLKETYGLGHGDANTLAHVALQANGAAAAHGAGDPLDDIYSGKKAHLRPIHDKLMAAIEDLGPFEIAPKKGYVSLRRKKQFAMLGPKTNERFELGLNLKDELNSPRLIKQAPGGMCQYIAPMTGPADVTKDVLAALRKAYDAAG